MRCIALPTTPFSAQILASTQLALQDLVRRYKNLNIAHESLQAEVESSKRSKRGKKADKTIADNIEQSVEYAGKSFALTTEFWISKNVLTSPAPNVPFDYNHRDRYKTDETRLACEVAEFHDYVKTRGLSRLLNEEKTRSTFVKTVCSAPYPLLTPSDTLSVRRPARSRTFQHDQPYQEPRCQGLRACRCQHRLERRYRRQTTSRGSRAAVKAASIHARALIPTR